MFFFIGMTPSIPPVLFTPAELLAVNKAPIQNQPFDDALADAPHQLLH